MASRVEGLDEKIIACAKNEFLQKGFADASLRAIAQCAGTSTSAIYIRYADKEKMFRALVEPAVSGVRELLERSLSGFDAQDDAAKKSNYGEYSDEGFPALIEFIYRYFDEFKLLAVCAPGNMYQEFLEEISKIDTQHTMGFLKLMSGNLPTSAKVKEGFVHVVSSAFYAGVFEVVIHDMNREEAEEYIIQLRRFYNCGWKDIFGN